MSSTFLSHANHANQNIKTHSTFLQSSMAETTAKREMPPPPHTYSLHDIGRMLFDMNIQFAKQDEELLTQELELEAFARQQNVFNKRIEESLAKLASIFRMPKEAPDPPAAATTIRGWKIPPSLTQAPPGVAPEVLPCLRFDPPRFDGDNARDWIHKIQTYYNHQYMPLHDRLYLTQYLFDHPASEWIAFWEENNKGKGWDELLVAVKQRFEPDSHDEYVGRLPALHQTCKTVAGVQGASPRPTYTSRDDRQHIHNKTSSVQVQDIISSEPPPPLMDRECFDANSRDSPLEARDFVPNIVLESENIAVKLGDVIFNGPFDSVQPTAIVAMEKNNEVDSSNDGVLKGVPRTILGSSGDAAGLLDPYYSVVFASKYSQFCSIIEIGGKDNSISLRIVRAPRYYSGNKYGHLGEVLLDGVGSRDTLQFGEEGVRIFDPGIFESDAIDAVMNPRRLQHDNFLFSFSAYAEWSLWRLRKRLGEFCGHTIAIRISHLEDKVDFDRGGVDRDFMPCPTRFVMPCSPSFSTCFNIN